MQILTLFFFLFSYNSKPVMCNSQYIIRLAHHGVDSVQLETRYDMGHHASDTKVHLFYFFNFCCSDDKS